MKNVLLFALLTLSFSSYSQLGIKGGFSIAKSLNYKTFGPSLGVNLGLSYELNERFRGEVLFERMNRKDEMTFVTISESQENAKFESVTVNNYIVPITVGIDYRIFTGKIQPFVGLNVGVMTLDRKMKGARYTDHLFTFHPKVGISVGLIENLKLEMVVKHHVTLHQKNNGAPNDQYYGANLGVNYSF